jgi:hypothetical protein
MKSRICNTCSQFDEKIEKLAYKERAITIELTEKVGFLMIKKDLL